MFQFTRRTNSLNIPDADREAVNETIRLFQERTGRNVGNSKDLFMGLLEYFQETISDQSNSQGLDIEQNSNEIVLLSTDDSQTAQMFQALLEELNFNDQSSDKVNFVISNMKAPDLSGYTPNDQVLVSSTDPALTQIFKQHFAEFEEKYDLIGKPTVHTVSLALGAALQPGPTNDEAIVRISFDNDDQVSAYLTLLSDYKQSVLENENISDAAAISHAIQNATLEIDEITPEQKGNASTSHDYDTGDIVIVLSDEDDKSAEGKKQLLELISRNRQAKYNFKEPESLSQVIERIVFTKSVICNYYGEFYTGINSRSLKKTNL